MGRRWHALVFVALLPSGTRGATHEDAAAVTNPLLEVSAPKPYAIVSPKVTPAIRLDFTNHVLGEAALESLQLCFHFALRGGLTPFLEQASCTEPLSTDPVLPVMTVPFESMHLVDGVVTALDFVACLVGMNGTFILHKEVVPVFVLARQMQAPVEGGEVTADSVLALSLLWRKADPSRLGLDQLIWFHTCNLLAFGNGMDHVAMANLLAKPEASLSAALCSDDAPPWIIAGVSWGQLTSTVVGYCPQLRIHGFEIIEEEAAKAAAQFRHAHPRVTIYAGVGLSEVPAIAHVRTPTASPTHSHVAIARGEVVQDGGGGWDLGEASIPVDGNEAFAALTTQLVSAAEWADEQGIEEFGYVVLDTEGHEPSVLRGMHLELERNRRRFPIIQFELGGTWAAQDPRRLPTETWTQFDAVSWMAYMGYDLFLIGDVGWLPVPPSYFDLTERPRISRWNNEGHGLFVQGNLLCVHRIYARGAVKRLVYSSAAQLIQFIAAFGPLGLAE